MRDLVLALDERAALGEGPTWDSVSECVYWVDIMGHRVHIYRPADKSHQMIQLDEFVTSIVPSSSGHPVITLTHGFYRLDLINARVSQLARVESELGTNRFNDGKCDPAGRFWAGTMAVDESPYKGSLYRLDLDGTITCVLNGVSISNGLAWSPYKNTMYYIDTPTKKVVAYNYDLDTGQIKEPKVVVRIPSGTGYPDGMTIDADGMLWIAHWGGGRISRWNPTNGHLLEEILVPSSYVTSCVFGGKDLTELYITTARSGLSQDELVKQPFAGGLFCLKTDVKGAPTAIYQDSTRPSTPES